MALHRRVRWIVTASALAALTIGMSPGSRDVSAKTRYIGSDHIVSWETLPDRDRADVPVAGGRPRTSARRRRAGAGELPPRPSRRPIG